MSWNILSIAHSGLNAAQVGVNVTGNNIANASVSGYNRQAPQQVVSGSSHGNQYIGMGTDIAGIQRVYSDVLTTQLRSAQSAQSGLEAFSTQVDQIDSLLSGSDSGLATALQSFQAGMKGLASNPSDPAYRQTAFASAQSLVDRFHGLGSQLSQANQNVNNQISDSITSINALAVQIAQSNKAISQAQQQDTMSDNPPNNLLDQRDQLLLTLSKQIKIDVVQQGSVVNVSFARGESLVLADQAFALKPVPSPSDPNFITAGQQKNGRTVAFGASDLRGGGVLGGLLQFSSESLKPAQNALGQIAIALASDFNAQNRLGQDANGTLGGDIFQVASPQVISNLNNTSSAKLAASISNADALTASDYSVRYEGGNYKITRLSDGSVLSNATTLPTQALDGIAFSLSSGRPNAGDEYLIRPTANGAPSIALLANDPAKLAAAAPIRTAVGTANTGTAKISAGVVDSSYPATPLAAGQSITLNYGAANNSFTLTPPMAVKVSLNGVNTTYPSGTPVPYTAGSTLTLGGISVSVTGSPANQDQFILSPNTGAKGDGRNATLLADLQTANRLEGGALGYQDAYARLVNRIGNTAQQVNANNDFETALMTTITNSQQSLSGVNLDEEAANLLKYQQAYQASAKVISIANQMFDVLFSIPT